jgi:hypothetical protein
MNKFIALLLIVIAPNAIIAQNGKSIPGFLGSKNCISLTAQANVNPNMDFFLQLFSPSKGIQFERVTSRRGSVSFGYTNQNITIDEYSFDAFHYKDNDLFVPAWNSYGYTSYKGRISFAENHFFIAKTYYHLALGSIAPQGAYMRFKYNLHWQKVTNDEMEYGNGVTTKKNPNGNSLYKTQNTSSFGLEFGRKRFFNKNLFIEKSVAFNLPNNFWHTSSDTKYSSIEDFNETHMNYYMSKNRTVQFHLSVGLAF